MSEQDKPEAVVVVVRRAGQVLVIRRGPSASRAGYWAPLSGRIEPGEREEEAVVRETREEVGLQVLPVMRAWECETDDGRYRLLWWIADAESGDLVLHPGEVSEARWIAPDEFAELEPTFAGDQRFFVEVWPRL